MVPGSNPGGPKRKTTDAEQWNAPTYDPWQYDATWTPVAGNETFGDYSFGDYPAFGQTAWSEWSTDGTNADPDVCVSNGNGIANVVDTINEGDIHEGDVQYGGVNYGIDEPGDTKPGKESFGDTKYGDSTATGPLTLLAALNGGLPKVIWAAPAV